MNDPRVAITFEFGSDDLDPCSSDVNVLYDVFDGTLTIAGLSHNLVFEATPLLGSVLTLSGLAVSLRSPSGFGSFPDRHAPDRVDFLRVDDSIWVSSTSLDADDAFEATALLDVLDEFCSWALAEAQQRHPCLTTNTQFTSWFSDTDCDDGQRPPDTTAPVVTSGDLRFEFEFDPDAPDPCDPHADLLYHVVTGDLVVRGPSVDLSARFGWIPLLNVAMQFASFPQRLAKPKSWAVLEFTESEDQLVFIRVDDTIRITASWTGDSVDVHVERVLAALSAFRTWAFTESVSRHPCLAERPAFRTLQREYA